MKTEGSILREHTYFDPALATNDSDGLPDTKVVPLVQALLGSGYTTLQSCQGHPGDKETRGSDGYLWIVEGPRVSRVKYFSPLFRVQNVVWFAGDMPPHWEFVWAWPDIDDALWALRMIYLWEAE